MGKWGAGTRGVEWTEWTLGEENRVQQLRSVLHPPTCVMSAAGSPEGRACGLSLWWALCVLFWG